MLRKKKKKDERAKSLQTLKIGERIKDLLTAKGTGANIIANAVVRKGAERKLYIIKIRKVYSIIHIKIFISVYKGLRNGFSEPLQGEDFESLCKAVQNQSKPPPKALK